MDKQPGSGPYRPLGNKLKNMREKAKETLADASGAVEIDVKQLASYELGQARPTEDVLLLLISHFGAKDDEALKIWELAGYGVSRGGLMHAGNEEHVASETPVVDAPKILFTDVVDVIVNNYGVVMNFMQGAGPNSQPNSVAKVGMSREHAKSVLRILEVTLSQTERTTSNQTKKFPAGGNLTPDDKQKN
jgi:transcriptional regulator with XRE-family HTH domain